MPFRRVRERFHTLPLASKCLVLFGAASVLLVLIAMWFPLLRMNALVGAEQAEHSRALVSAWRAHGPASAGPGQAVPFAGSEIRVFTPEEAAASGDAFVRSASELFAKQPTRQEVLGGAWRGWSRVYSYARAERGEGAEGGELTRVIVLERRSDGAGWQLLVNLALVISAGVVVLAVALVVFAWINRRLILEPVEKLRSTAESVRDGHLDARAAIATGDEFEELAGAFNLMLGELQSGQDRLRSINRALDLKLNELSESNVALFEAARLKGEFLASVSHELRTPLNSIIGFAELLLEIARAEGAAALRGDPADPDLEALEKRQRYLGHIVTAGRSLLELIESLLEMAKIEAGRVEVRPEQVDLADVCQGLVGLIFPLAQRRGVRVTMDVQPDLPTIVTDPKKLHQILFNLLSNAVKFTSGLDRQGEITLRAERLPSAGEGRGEQVRVSVIDNGTGISTEDQQRVFDKFQQAQSGHTRDHSGAGLGLAIVRELTKLLKGEVQLVSELGRGSMFSIILPVRPYFDTERAGADEPEGEAQTAPR